MQKAESGEVLVLREKYAYQYRPTSLRRNKLYYQLYCVGLNTLIASIVPLVALIYLNISTVKALKKMKFQHRRLQQEIHLESPVNAAKELNEEDEDHYQRNFQDFLTGNIQIAS